MEGAETPLDRLRQRIVGFLGSLGGSVNGCLIETGSAAVHAAKMVAWDSKSLLEFALPFQDMKPSIYLGVCVCACLCIYTAYVCVFVCVCVCVFVCMWCVCIVYVCVFVRMKDSDCSSLQIPSSLVYVNWPLLPATDRLRCVYII